MSSRYATAGTALKKPPVCKASPRPPSHVPPWPGSPIQLAAIIQWRTEFDEPRETPLTLNLDQQPDQLSYYGATPGPGPWSSTQLTFTADGLLANLRIDFRPNPTQVFTWIWSPIHTTPNQIRFAPTLTQTYPDPASSITVDLQAPFWQGRI